MRWGWLRIPPRRKAVDMRGSTTPSASEDRPARIRIRRTTRVLATLAGVAVAAGTAGASYASSSGKEARESQPREATSPFTGLPADPAPVMAVKIDNHKDARPHTELDKADIVF